MHNVQFNNNNNNNIYLNLQCFYILHVCNQSSFISSFLKNSEIPVALKSCFDCTTYVVKAPCYN